ncbi:GNAT family N-acetyltransferase [Paenibacillus sp. GCM10027626]|uniref:GNAT family N-acetyltransferase n=1 Tax=Paenibacillus sp. GCM10027626 TaxID=3273411 RepID=UPI00362EFF5A
MNHSITAERFGVRLRPVERTDAAFIYELRRKPGLTDYIGEFPADFTVHQAWLERYFDQENDYYFCIELLSGTVVGTIAIYDIVNNSGNWGRWIISPKIPAAPASVWLMFHIAFDILGLSSVYSNTVADNGSVLSFHDSCGVPRTGVERGGLTIKGVEHDLIIHTAHKELWPAIQKRLEKSAVFAERMFQETLL